jgi:hypothetical protein
MTLLTISLRFALVEAGILGPLVWALPRGEAGFGSLGGVGTRNTIESCIDTEWKQFTHSSSSTQEDILPLSKSIMWADF